jgi:hypothetical protein
LTFDLCFAAVAVETANVPPNTSDRAATNMTSLFM